ncbi:hypothetical protein FQR65_LT08703 [Abscondita terminalis]|nr:hypothetical protein FQR65_LT08703 [Abscondita terminalis]
MFDPEIVETYPDYPYTEESDVVELKASLAAAKDLIDKFKGLGRIRRMNEWSDERIRLLRTALEYKGKNS